MGYDLYLTAQAPAPHGIKRLRAKLDRHPHIAVDEAVPTFSNYNNPETFVAFYFDMMPGGVDDGPQKDHVTLTIPFFTPTAVIFEVRALLQSLHAEVGLEVMDLQHGQGEWEPPDLDAIETGYRKSAASAVRALAKAEPEALPGKGRRVPRALLDYAWQWNHARPQRVWHGKKHDRNMWIPLYEFIEIGGQCFSYVNWFDGVSTLFPKTHLIGITRNKYQLRSPGLFGRKRPSLIFVAPEALQYIWDVHYQADPVWPEAISPTIQGINAGQDMFLARKLGQDSITDVVYLDSDDYKRRDPKPWVRHRFWDLIDEELFSDI